MGLPTVLSWVSGRAGPSAVEMTLLRPTSFWRGRRQETRDWSTKKKIVSVGREDTKWIKRNKYKWVIELHKTNVKIYFWWLPFGRSKRYLSFVVNFIYVTFVRDNDLGPICNDGHLTRFGLEWQNYFYQSFTNSWFELRKRTLVFLIFSYLLSHWKTDTISQSKIPF